MLGSLLVVSTELSSRGLASLSFHPTCLNAHFSLMPLLSSIPFLLHFFSFLSSGIFLFEQHAWYLFEKGKPFSLHIYPSKGVISTLLPKGDKRVFLTSFGFAFSQTSVEQKRLLGQVNLEKGTEFVCSDISVLTTVHREATSPFLLDAEWATFLVWTISSIQRTSLGLCIQVCNISAHS